MTSRELAETLSAYASGLEAELALLRHIQRLSGEQHEATQQQDSARLQHITEERGRLMSGLVKIEHEIRESRQLLADYQWSASRLPRFGEVVSLHRSATALVERIIVSDQETMTALESAEIARREAAQALEAGETTLNAYRRVINPGTTGPSLVDQRG